MSLEKSLLGVLTRHVDARPLALCRIAVGLAAAWKARHITNLLHVLYSPEIVRAKYFSFFPDIPFEHIEHYSFLWAFLSLAFCAGFYTTWSGMLLAVVVAYPLILDQNLFENHLYLLFLLIVLLTIAQSGRAYSYDSYRRRMGGLRVPYLPCFLIQFQISLLYFYAAAGKLNSSFLSGEVLRTELFFGDRLSPLILIVLSWATILLEWFLTFGLWNRYMQRPAFVLGALFHMTIPIAMPTQWAGLTIFSILSVSPYILFLHREPQPGLVVWDDECSFCRTWIRLFEFLDWLSVYRFAGSSNPAALLEIGITHAEADVELKLKTGGRVLGGFDAVREILCNLPVTFLLAPLLSLPGIRDLGHRAYRAVAARRRCGLSRQSRA